MYWYLWNYSSKLSEKLTYMKNSLYCMCLFFLCFCRTPPQTWLRWQGKAVLWSAYTGIRRRNGKLRRKSGNWQEPSWVTSWESRKRKKRWPFLRLTMTYSTRESNIHWFVGKKLVRKICPLQTKRIFQSWFNFEWKDTSVAYFTWLKIHTIPRCHLL